MKLSHSPISCRTAVCLVMLIGLRLAAVCFAQMDKYQRDIPTALVQRVDQAKEKQVSGMNLESASQELKAVLQQKPDYYRARYNLGLLQYSLGKPEEALTTLEQALQTAQTQEIKDSSLLNSISWIRMNQGKLGEAESGFLTALENTPNNEKEERKRLLNNLGYLYLQKGETARAAAYLEQAVRIYDSAGATEVLKLVDAAEQQAVVIAEAAPPSTNPPETYQDEITALFSDSGTERSRGYDRLTRTDLRKDPALPVQIIAQARENSENEKGVRMAVVTLRDMSRLATQTAENKPLIEAFAAEAAAKFPELQSETQSLLKWLATPRL